LTARRHERRDAVAEAENAIQRPRRNAGFVRPVLHQALVGTGEIPARPLTQRPQEVAGLVYLHLDQFGRARMDVHLALADRQAGDHDGLVDLAGPEARLFPDEDHRVLAALYHEGSGAVLA